MEPRDIALFHICTPHTRPMHVYDAEMTHSEKPHGKVWLFLSSLFILLPCLFLFFLASLEAASVSCSSKNKDFQPCSGSFGSTAGLLEPAYVTSEASNLAMASRQTGT